MHLPVYLFAFVSKGVEMTGRGKGGRGRGEGEMDVGLKNATNIGRISRGFHVMGSLLDVRYHIIQY